MGKSYAQAVKNARWMNILVNCVIFLLGGGSRVVTPQKEGHRICCTTGVSYGEDLKGMIKRKGTALANRMI